MTSNNVKITVHQTSKLIDTRLDVVISGLLLKTKVTVALGVQESKAVFVSYAHFTSDSLGTVRLSRDAAQGGTYTGVDAMGLFWSMQPTTEHVMGTRLIKLNVLTPLTFTIAVFDGHIKVDSILQMSSDAALCREKIERWYHDASQVDRIQIRHGRLRGALFIPKNRGQCPGVLDFYGGSGTLVDIRGALLAAKGFVIFTLAYGHYEDLPDFKIELDYFDEAIDFLRSQPAVLPGGVGVMANCKGSEMALHLYIYNAHVRATVAINGWAWYASPTVPPDTKPYEIFDPNLEKLIRTEKGIILYVPCGPSVPHEIPENAIIPVEKCPDDRQLLLMQCEDDLSSGRHLYSFLTDRLQKAGKTNFRLLSYPGAGHLLDPPYTPLNRTVYFGMYGAIMEYGGRHPGHAKAQQDYWLQVETFFKTNLPASNSVLGRNNFESKL